MLGKVRAWEAEMLRLALRPEMHARERWVGYRKRTAKSMRMKLRQMGLPTMANRIVDNIWTTVSWAIHDGEVPVMRSLRSILGWRTAAWWRSRSAWSMKKVPANVT